MGRRYTGSQVTNGCLRIELGLLLKTGMLKKGKILVNPLCWTNKFDEKIGSILLYTCWTEKEKYIRPVYSVSDKNGIKHKYDYQIQLTTVPSNLGKGEVLYFVCPESGKRCRILYQAYDYPKWKSRDAYLNRIYYSSQNCSKREYANERYWALERRIKRLKRQKYFKWSYNGKPTKRALKLQELIDQQNYWDEKRWSLESFPMGLRKALERSLLLKT